MFEVLVYQYLERILSWSFWKFQALAEVFSRVKKGKTSKS